MTAPSKIPLSVVIIAQDEEDHIVACLQSVVCVAELVVVDGGSTDRTVELARKMGAVVVERPFDGFIEQKNAAIDAARFDWVLSLDVDERLLSELIVAVTALFQNGAEPPLPGYFMPRLFFHLGRWIHHGGWYPDRKLRLIDRRRGRWGGRKVHEKMVLQGESGLLKGDLLHFPYRDYQHHLTKMDRYTSLASELLYEEKRQWPRLRMFVQPPLQFLKSYVLRRGFLDGAAGLTLARLSARYEWLRYSKLARLYAGGKI